MHAKEENLLIVYAPLWKTMKKKGATTYTLRVRHGFSHATVQRLQKDMPVSTYTLNRLCEILRCGLPDVAEYVEEKQETPQPDGR